MMRMLPDELMLEILIRLPGKQLGRCKCVCKSWQSIIRSPPFSEAYRSRRFSLILCQREDVDPATIIDGKDLRLRYFYSALCRLKEPPTEEFSYLSELRIGRQSNGITETVNGLLCVFESDLNLNIYNVCTDQRMKLPEPVRYSPDLDSSFHLGYDHVNKMYKLLRLMNPVNRRINQPLQAEIMNLQPSNQLSTWRKLDNNVCGIGDMLALGASITYGASSLSGNGFLWWLLASHLYLFAFDLNKEKFQMIKLPEDVRDVIVTRRGGIVFTPSMGHPAVWVPPTDDHPKYYTLCVFDHDKSNTWSKHHVELPEELRELNRFAVATGNLPSGEILMMNVDLRNQDGSRTVYSYNHQTSKFYCFLVGRLPDKKPNDTVRRHRRNLIRTWNSITKISCLHDNNALLSTLDDVLSGRVLS